MHYNSVDDFWVGEGLCRLYVLYSSACEVASPSAPPFPPQQQHGRRRQLSSLPRWIRVR